MLLRGELTAVVTCVEWRLGWMMGSDDAAATDDDTLSTTNIFERSTDGTWQLILHRAWPVSSVADEMSGDCDYDAEDFPGATG